MATIRCPHCGSPVMIRGNRWQCGWCGDFGAISSLHPSEKAKLMQAATPSISFTITVADTSDDEEEETPRSFSRTELEDMVRRWDFSENEWACRDLLIAAFPEAVRRWSAEELSEMDDGYYGSLAGNWRARSRNRDSDDETLAGHSRESSSGSRGSIFFAGK